VLHLHLSDFCRFAVESKVFPALTANLTGLQAGFYTQQEVGELISYAQQRGIRVVPEIDLPGHARGLLPLEAAGLKFCTSAATRSQVYDDPGNMTSGMLEKLLTEMSGLFSDSVMNIGSDETHSKGPCSLGNTAGLERKMIATVLRLGKQPMAWVNALTTTKVATPSTILDTWATVYGMPDLVTKQGYQCVASTYMYLNHIAGDVGSYQMYWRDIAPGEWAPNVARADRVLDPYIA
jgi:N-acetyl-beta-hexosaminidase